jgi:hypothetical protein
MISLSLSSLKNSLAVAALFALFVPMHVQAFPLVRPLPATLTNCVMQDAGHGEQDPRNFSVNVTFICHRPLDELAATLAVENYAKDIVRDNVQGKGACRITNSSLTGDLLTRGLPGEENIPPDQTAIRYVADVSCAHAPRGYQQAAFNYGGPINPEPRQPVFDYGPVRPTVNLAAVPAEPRHHRHGKKAHYKHHKKHKIRHVRGSGKPKVILAKTTTTTTTTTTVEKKPLKKWPLPPPPEFVQQPGMSVPPATSTSPLPGAKAP